MKKNRLLLSYLKIFLISFVLIFIVHYGISFNSKEAYPLYLVYYAVVSSFFNTLFLIGLRVSGVSKTNEWKILVLICEVLLYFAFQLGVEEIISSFGLRIKNGFFQFPFTLIYPLIPLSILVLLLRNRL